MTPNTKFVVMRDQDSADCLDVKRTLVATCAASGQECIVRIACHELESFYLGDLEAVASALDQPGLANRQAERRYRDPDRLSNACDEFERLIGVLYEKIEGSRRIGEKLALDGRNRSRSFNALINALRVL